MRYLLLLALVGCSSNREKVQRAAPLGSQCHTDVYGAYCVTVDLKLYACNIDGSMADCVQVGTVTPVPLPPSTK